MFRSIRHEIFTLEVNKVALNKNDDKRIAKKDGISTLARGHKDYSLLKSVKFLTLYKMPYSKNKQVFFNAHEQYGTLSCSCGKVMEYSSARELKLKIKLHMKVCNNPPKRFEVRNPKVKSMV